MSDGDNSEKLLKRAYDIQNADEAKKLYRDWAASYDDTMVDGLTYSAPSTVARMLAGHVADKTGMIIDLGCGTGLTGKAVHDLGFVDLVGLDFSSEMLEQARKLNIYSELINADLTTRLDFATGHFAGAVASGIFTHGHLDATCLPEIFRVIKPGGMFCCVVRVQVWHEMGFAQTFTGMEKDGVIMLVDERLDGNYQKSKQPDGRYLVYRKL